MTSFGLHAVSYTQNADHNYSWHVSYGLSSSGGHVDVALKVHLTGVDPGAALKAAWLSGVNQAWNQRAFFDDGTQLLPVNLHFAFVTAGANQTVNVHPGTGHYDMLNWYQISEWGISYHDESAAHEVGHMLGNFDEYSGGATYNLQTYSPSLMGTLAYAGFQRYYWAVEYFTEQYGYGGANALHTVLAIRGDAGDNTLTGGAGRNGFYGFGGVDTIHGAGGKDYLDGGGGGDFLFGDGGGDKLFGQAGSDFLNGGAGPDQMAGGPGADSFAFDSPLVAGNVDTITGFQPGFDKIVLDHHVFARLAPAVPLAAKFFHTDAAATHANDTIIYTYGTGALIYDSNGSGAGHAFRFATLAPHLALTHSDFLVA